MMAYRRQKAQKRVLQSQAISLSDIEGNVLANGTVKYIKMPFDKIADADVHKQVLLHATDNVSEI